MKEFFYNRAKLQKHVILEVLVVGFGVVLLFQAPFIGKLLGIAAVLFVGYDAFQKMKLLRAKGAQLIVTDDSITIKLDSNLVINAGSIVEAETRSTGTGMVRLLFQNRELHVLYQTEVRGQLYNKREVVDITYLDISDDALHAILKMNAVQNR